MVKLRRYLRLARIALVLAEGATYASWVGLNERLGSIPLARRQRLTNRFMTHLSAALPFLVEVRGELPSRPALWLSNHVSWIDIPVLASLCPLSFLSKAEVASWPVAGWLAQRAGTLFIERGNADLSSLSADIAGYLKQDCHLLIFPEGTSSDGSSVLRFHPRLLAAACNSGMPIQPVALRYRRHGERCELAPFIGDDELPEHLMRLLDNDRAEVEIELLPLIETSELSRSELARLAHGAISDVVCPPPPIRQDEEDETSAAA